MTLQNFLQYKQRDILSLSTALFVPQEIFQICPNVLLPKFESFAMIRGQMEESIFEDKWNIERRFGGVSFLPQVVFISLIKPICRIK